MSEGANAELIRKVFADANRMAEVGGFDAWLDFFSEESSGRRSRTPQTPARTEAMRGFAATSRTGSRRSTDSTMSCAG
jgi:hypothetical protein